MLRKSDLGRIISDRFALRGGKRIPFYLGEWMVDYVLEAIKIGLIEDGVVNIMNYMTFRRVEIPEHEHRMPDGTIKIIPARPRIRVEYKEDFMKGITTGELKEIDYGRKKKI